MSFGGAYGAIIFTFLDQLHFGAGNLHLGVTNSELDEADQCSRNAQVKCHICVTDTANHYIESLHLS